MKKTAALIVTLTVSTAILAPTFGKSPLKIAEVAPIGDLVAEAESKLEKLTKYLENEEEFAVAQELDIPQAAGVLACLAQAIAEHPEREQTKAQGPQLRDAAQAISESTKLQDATAALAEANKAMAGTSTKEAQVEHPWNKLLTMYPMMEEINSRNSQISRALRRLRKPEEESRHASTIAVLTVAMYADTHEVKNEADIPQWQEYSRQFQQSMTGLAAAMKSEDLDAAKMWRMKATEACDACHEKFRDNEQ